MLMLAVLLALGGARAEPDQAPEDPNTVLAGVYSDCVLGMDWTCLQRRSLLFVDRVSRIQRFPLFPGLAIVRTAPLPDPLEARALERMDGDRLYDLMDNAVAVFFEQHVVRVEVPTWLKSEGKAMGDIDFFFGEGVEARGKKKKKKLLKLLKKILLLAVLLAIAKKLLLLPLILGMIKMASIKGLLFGFISLVISKVMILKKLKQKMMDSGMMSGGWMMGGGGGGDSGWPSSGGGGGGGGGHGMAMGGGGWDRSMASHDLAYNSYTPKPVGEA